MNRAIASFGIALVLFVGATLNNVTPESQPVAQETVAASEHPSFGPIVHIVHGYTHTIDFDSFACEFFGLTRVNFDLDDIGAGVGDRFVTASVVIVFTDFDDGAAPVDRSSVRETRIAVEGNNTGCATAPTGAIAAIVTGTLTPSGDTFIIQVLVS